MVPCVRRRNGLRIAQPGGTVSHLDGAWLCPICATLVEIEGEYTAAGWCNSERCVLDRVKRRLFSKPCRGPEILAAEYRGAEA